MKSRIGIYLRVFHDGPTLQTSFAETLFSQLHLTGSEITTFPATTQPPTTSILTKQMSD